MAHCVREPRSLSGDRCRNLLVPVRCRPADANASGSAFEATAISRGHLLPADVPRSGTFVILFVLLCWTHIPELHRCSLGRWTRSRKLRRPWLLLVVSFR